MGEPLTKVNLEEKFSLFEDAWKPYVVGELGVQQVKLAKFRGDFDWHFHEHEDELFLVVKGVLRMGLRDPEERDVEVQVGEFLIVPRGVEHRPAGGDEAWILMLEPSTTLNTGNLQNERTVAQPDRL